MKGYLHDEMFVDFGPSLVDYTQCDAIRGGDPITKETVGQGIVSINLYLQESFLTMIDCLSTRQRRGARLPVHASRCISSCSAFTATLAG